MKALVALLLLFSAGYSRKASVAIVGAGVGGASTAYWLGKELSNQIDITVYESQNRVGGRVQDAEFAFEKYELGAAIYVSGNKYIVELAEAMGLEALPPSHTGNRFGLYDGSNFVYETSKLGALIRYGPRVLKRLKRSVLSFFTRFEQIYTMQASKRSFATPKELWQALGLWNYTQQTFDDFLRHEILPKNQGATKFINELAYAVNRVNYNQGNEINALTGSVSLCPAFSGQKVLTIHQGNAQLVQSLLANSTLRLNEKVSEISADGDLVTASNIRKHYDAIILATPIEASGSLRLSPSSMMSTETNDINSKWQNYSFQTTYTTFVLGANRILTEAKLSSLYIVAHLVKPFPASSVSTLYSFDNGTSLYKLFSRHPLETADLDEIFLPGWTIMAKKHWPFAYPKLYPFQHDPPPFRLSDQLFYLNTLELATSAMEIAAIAGRNVALLTAESLRRRRLLSSPPPSPSHCAMNLDEGQCVSAS